MLLEENQIAFHSEDGLNFDGVKDYSRQVAEMIGLGSDTEFPQAGIRTVLDIGCGFGSFGAHLVSRKVMPICTAAYEATGSQVQLALERGLPAMIGNFISRQFPYPSLSFDMVHCTQCSCIWDDKDGMFLIEVDQILKPGGYFVLTPPASKPSASSSRTKKMSMVAPIEEFTEKICWSLMAQQDETFIWQKTADANCYKSRKSTVPPVCNEGNDLPPYYQPLLSCISGTTRRLWIPIQNRSSEQLSSYELQVHGEFCHIKISLFSIYHHVIQLLNLSLPMFACRYFFEDSQVWRSALRNNWSLQTPLIFSDHPKWPGDEDPLPPFNMLRNVMDMNAHYGGLNAAFLEERKSVWVMNVVPVRARNTLALMMDRGFAGVLHDW
ncbi:Probable methyltransferase PMT4 [Linum perenne]